MTSSTFGPRAREIGIPLTGETGPNNNITDVPGIEIGYSTIVEGVPEDFTSYDSAFARTGVTAILPRGKNRSTVRAAFNTLNGYGEFMGSHFISDYGYLEGPIMLTNTFSAGIVRDAAYKWFFERDLIQEICLFGEAVPGGGVMYTVVGETWDGVINNIHGDQVKPKHVFEALDNAISGPIAEGNVGGGTGMQTHLFKGGSGSSSRKVKLDSGEEFTVATFTQANHGMRDCFHFRGVPLGKEIQNCDPILNGLPPGSQGEPMPPEGSGSIVVVVATDAPLSAKQLSRVARRVPMGVASLGGGFENTSGDIFLAISTGNDNDSINNFGINTSSEVSDSLLDPIYRATADATEEAILNAMVAAETMTGINDNTLFALPHKQTIEILKKYGQV